MMSARRSARRGGWVLALRIIVFSESDCVYALFSLFSSCHYSESRPPRCKQITWLGYAVHPGRGVARGAGVRPGSSSILALSDGRRRAPGRSAKWRGRALRVSAGKHPRGLLMHPRSGKDRSLLTTFRRRYKGEILTGAAAGTDAGTRCPARSRRGGAQAARTTTTSGSGRGHLRSVMTFG